MSRSCSCCFAAACCGLRRGRFDLALDLQGLFRSGLMAWATGAPRRVGLAGAREGASWFYTDIVDIKTPTCAHAVDRYLAAARSLAVVLLVLGRGRLRDPEVPAGSAW